MLLLISPPRDVLAVHVLRHASARGLELCHVDIGEVCEGRASIRPDGCLQRRGQPPEKISGALLRLQPSWWQSNRCSALGNEPWEVVAGWYSALSSLQCPVVNRFGLGWWTGEPTYNDQLRALLASLLRQAPGTEADPHGEVWLAGREVFAAPQDSHLVEWARRERRAISAWQAQTGVVFSRLDCAGTRSPSVLSVDPLPHLDELPGDLISAISAALVRILKNNGVPARPCANF